VLLTVAPLCIGFFTSLTNYDGFDPADSKFIGVDNYTRAFTDDRMSFSLGRTLLWAAINTPLWLLVTFGMALALNAKGLKSRTSYSGHVVVASPGTEMWEILEKHGQVFSHDMDWSQIAIQDDQAHFAFGDLDKETIERKWHEAHRRFYLRPSRIARIVTRGDTWRRFPYYLRTAGSMLLGLGERQTT